MTMTVGQETFVAGETITWSATFQYTEDDELVDPGQVTFSYYIDPTSPVYFYYGITADIVRDGVGLYHIDLDSTGFTPPKSQVLVVGQFAGSDPARTVDSVMVKVIGPAMPILFT